MSKQIINTSNAPAPIGPYNQSVKAGNLLFISGQIALVPASGELLTGSVEEETHQVMKNLKAILTEAGTDFGSIVKTTIFLSDMNLFSVVQYHLCQLFFKRFSCPCNRGRSWFAKGCAC